MTTEIDFYKKFRLPHPLCGLVSKITSPKGIRKQETETYYSYHLHTDLRCIYADRATRFEPGLYWVLNVCKPMGTMEWYHYLFVVEEDGNVYPVAEFLKQVDSTWIPDALPTIKDYFAGKTLEPIKITPIRQFVPKKTRWDQVSR